MFIYLIVNHVTGKYYVGQHKGKFWDARHQRNGRSYLYNSMRKYPDPSLWSIHALLSDIETREELDQREKEFIEFLRSRDPEYGYNICKGGEGFTGPHSEATRQLLSTTRRSWHANPANADTRKLMGKRISDAKKGVGNPPLTKICLICSRPFSVPFSKRNSRLFCSPVCYYHSSNFKESSKRLENAGTALRSTKVRAKLSEAQHSRRERERMLRSTLM
jgi:hypothetical protein